MRHTQPVSASTTASSFYVKRCNLLYIIMWSQSVLLTTKCPFDNVSGQIFRRKGGSLLLLGWGHVDFLHLSRRVLVFPAGCHGVTWHAMTTPLGCHGIPHGLPWRDMAQSWLAVALSWRGMARTGASWYSPRVIMA